MFSVQFFIRAYVWDVFLVHAVIRTRLIHSAGLRGRILTYGVRVVLVGATVRRHSGYRLATRSGWSRVRV